MEDAFKQLVEKMKADHDYRYGWQAAIAQAIGEEIAETDTFGILDKVYVRKMSLEAAIRFTDRMLLVDSEKEFLFT